MTTVDLTGGAPELNPSFRCLVAGARALGRHVIVRHNLTVQFEPGMDDLVAFFAAHEVEVVASLPCYTAENVDAQRGKGVFGKSIDALARLNAAGFGVAGSTRVLTLVYNPGGAFLPGPEAALEADYRARLHADLGIAFTRLVTITNMPFKRFAHDLARAGKLAASAAARRARRAGSSGGLVGGAGVTVGRLGECASTGAGLVDVGEASPSGGLGAPQFVSTDTSMSAARCRAGLVGAVRESLAFMRADGDSGVRGHRVRSCRARPGSRGRRRGHR